MILNYALGLLGDDVSNVTVLFFVLVALVPVESSDVRSFRLKVGLFEAKTVCESTNCSSP